MGEKVLSEILNLAAIQSPQIAYDKKSIVETPDKNTFFELITQVSAVHEQPAVINIPSNGVVQTVPEEMLATKEPEINATPVINDLAIEVANVNELEEVTELAELAGLTVNLIDTSFADVDFKDTNFVVIEKQVAGDYQHQVVNYNLDTFKQLAIPSEAMDEPTLEVSSFENDEIKSELSSNSAALQDPDRREAEGITREYLVDLFVEPKLKVAENNNENLDVKQVELVDDQELPELSEIVNYSGYLTNANRQTAVEAEVEDEVEAIAVDKAEVAIKPREVADKAALLDIKYSREIISPLLSSSASLSAEVKKDKGESEKLVSNKDVLNIINKASFIKPEKDVEEVVAPAPREHPVLSPILEAKEAKEANANEANVREVNVREAEVEPALNMILPKSLVVEVSMKPDDQPALISSGMERRQFVSPESFNLENTGNESIKQMPTDLIKNAGADPIPELAVEDLESTAGQGDSNFAVNPKVLQGFQNGLFREEPSHPSSGQLDTLNHALKEVEYKLSANKNSQNMVDHIRIELHPESLGRVDINFKQETDGAVKVDILCETFEAMSLLKNSEERINAILGDNGFSSNKNSLNFSFSENKNNQNGRQMQFEASFQNQPANQEVENYHLVKKYAGIMMVDDGKLDIKV